MSSILSQRWPWVVSAVIVVLVYGATIVEVSAPSDGRPVGSIEDVASLAERDDVNLLFIVIDTLRADRLGSYGYDRDTSPHMDRLAETGIRFSRHLAQSSWTKCSMASLWTGLLPARTGVTRFNHVLPEEALMPAEILRENGFRTVGIYRNGWVSGYFGFEQGFDVYQKPQGSPLPTKVHRENPTLSLLGNDMSAVEMSIEFLRLHGRDRWFLYVHQTFQASAMAWRVWGPSSKVSSQRSAPSGFSFAQRTETRRMSEWWAPSATRRSTQAVATSGESSATAAAMRC